MVKQPAHRPVSDPSSPRRRRRLSRAVIGRAVIEVGFDNATLVAVAEHLGCNHATLYGHVKNRDDMVLAGVELVLEELDDTPISGTWREAVRGEAMRIWRLLIAYPGLPEAIGMAPEPSDQVTQRYAALGAYLLELGFEPRAAVLSAQTAYHAAADSSERERKAFQTTDDQLDSWVAQLDPALQEAMGEYYSSDPEARFVEEIEMLLDGIEARYSPS